MSIIRYQAFIKTVECGSFTKAALQLGYTQSGISHMINALEEEVGIPLLTRDRGGLHLTADGERLLPYFSQICNLQHQMEETVKDLKGLDTGLVRIGSFTSVSVQWIPALLKSFGEIYPNIEFEILHGDYDEIESWIASGRVDCGFLRLPAKRPLDTYPIYKDQWMVILPPGHPLESIDPIPKGELTKWPFIQMDEGTDYEIEAVFDALRIRPRIQYTTKEDQTILAMVSNGLGISMMPELMLHNTPYPVVRRKLEYTFERNIGIAVKNKKTLSVSTRRFLEHVCQWVSAYD
ncbi:MAG: LysR family transcriptional regulator [Clostridiales bacterium]|nr:LysR family transcriptional regulator [Clostridiales bacterium]